MTQGASPARRLFLRFLLAVAVLHAGAIGLYYALDVAHTPARQQRLFAWTWMGLTVAVVFVGLRRIKRARRPR